MAKVFVDTGNGFEYLGDSGPLRINWTIEPLDAEVVLEDILDAEEVGTEPSLIING